MSKVLLVDDDRAVLFALSELLRDRGHVDGRPAPGAVRVVDRDRDLRTLGEVAGVLRPRA